MEVSLSEFFFSIFFSIWLTKDGTTCMAVCPWVSPKYTKADYSAPRRNASAQRDPAAVKEMCFWSVTGGRSSCSLSMVAAFSFIFIHFHSYFIHFSSIFHSFFQFEDGLWQELALPNLWYQAMTVMWLPNFGRAAGEPRNGWKWRYPGFYNNVGIKVTNKKLSHFSCECARDDADFLMKPSINGNFLHRGPRCPSGPRIFGPRVGPGIRMADNECRRVALPHRP